VSHVVANVRTVGLSLRDETEITGGQTLANLSSHRARGRFVADLLRSATTVVADEHPPRAAVELDLHPHRPLHYNPLRTSSTNASTDDTA
jgi:hypothetical protein